MEPPSKPSVATPVAPRVTVVLTAYNYARYLPSAITSVQGQSFTDWELRVVDDGSTDDTAEVVRSFAASDPRIHYLHQANAGLSAARNTGIRSARGAFVALLDADDAWEPAFLRRTLEAFAGLPDDFALVATHSRLMDAAGRLLPASSRSGTREREVRAEDLILKNRFAADAVLVRREAFEASGMFDETLRSSEDRDMWIRIGGRHRIHWCPEVLVRVRRHGENMSGNCDRMRENIARVLRKARAARGGGRLFWLRVAAYDRVQGAWMLHSNGRRAEAVGNILLSMLLWPCFLDPSKVGEPVLFRLRSLARFVIGRSDAPRRTGAPGPAPSAGGVGS